MSHGTYNLSITFCKKMLKPVLVGHSSNGQLVLYRTNTDLTDLSVPSLSLTDT